MNDNADQPATRPPATQLEHVLTNCRPQPAIPAVLAMMLLVLIPLMPLAGADVSAGTVRLLLIGFGILSSAGLAIAAGLCSFAPQAIWLAIAAWAHSLLVRGDLPQTLFWLLYAAALGVILGIAAQLWRVKTGRFVPTIKIDQ